MSIEFRDAVRRDVPLLVLVSGGTGAGKTESALRLATGMAKGQPFAVLDTEHGRALHKADDYKFKHAEFDEPFTPERYIEHLHAADAAGFPVVVIDSGSHEYEGMGGVLDIQLAEFERMGKRDSARMSSWIVPKQRHKAFVRELLRTRAHVVMTLRAEDKIDIVKDSDGKTKVVPKASLVGAEGWIPICEKRLPFEATISLLLTADAPGVPKPIKLERRHQEFVPLDRQLDESVGLALAEWARGGESSGNGQKGALPGESFEDIFEGAVTQESSDQKATTQQKKKLDVLVGQLREADRLRTEHLFQAVGHMRDVDDGDLARAMPSAIDDEGVLHWGPLRDTLSRAEASNLVDRLSKLQEAQ